MEMRWKHRGAGFMSGSMLRCRHAKAKGEITKIWEPRKLKETVSEYERESQREFPSHFGGVDAVSR
jgi:hypothetical protein